MRSVRLNTNRFRKEASPHFINYLCRGSFPKDFGKPLRDGRLGQLAYPVGSVVHCGRALSHRKVASFLPWRPLALHIRCRGF